MTDRVTDEFWNPVMKFMTYVVLKSLRLPGIGIPLSCHSTLSWLCCSETWDVSQRAQPLNLRSSLSYWKLHTPPPLLSPSSSWVPPSKLQCEFVCKTCRHANKLDWRTGLNRQWALHLLRKDKIHGSQDLELKIFWSNRALVLCYETGSSKSLIY